MAHPYKTREGGATVTVFVPYDCQNNCPFCINKKEYADCSGFSLEKILASIQVMDGITPRCDFVFTGGEPLVRKNVAQLVAGLKAIPGIRKVTMTTNGILLAQQLPALLAAGLDSVNISLDTLRPEVFRQITARDEFAAVQAGLQAALESGIPVKLNCVPQAGVNEGELEDLAALAENRPLQVRFIEMMPIGFGAGLPGLSGPAAL